MITEQQSEMIDYLIAGNNKTDTAKLLGISRQTVHTWSNLPEIKAEKQKRLNEIKRDAKNKIGTKVYNCIDVIYDIAMKSKDMRTKFQAAKYLCDQFIGSPVADKSIEDEEVKVKEPIDIDSMLEKIHRQEQLKNG